MNSLNWQAPYPPFIYPHTVTEDELDFLGHVNNKTYLAWMEKVAWAHAKSVGISHEKQRELNRIMAVYENCMQYLASCYLGDELLIATWIGETKGYCLRDRGFQIVRKSDEKTVFTATTTYVCIDLQNHKPKRIPKAFIEPYFK
jgi:acyl-CoA thioester hydrolase